MSQNTNFAFPAVQSGTGTSGTSAQLDENQKILLQQQRVMDTQDAALDNLSVSVKNLKNMGRDINDELNMQNHLLNDLERGVDSTAANLNSRQNQLTKLMKKASNGKYMCAIFLLIIILVFLLMWIFYFDKQ